ncbi:MAG: head-tail connector protein [Hyphomicrobiaceae bacterium]
MSLVLTSGPALEPVTLAEAKAHLRLDSTADDALLQSLIITSRLHIEAALGLALITQSWSWTLDQWPKGQRLSFPLRPVQAVAHVKLWRRDTSSIIVPLTEFILDGHGNPARLVPAGLTPLSEPDRPVNGIEVAFTAGFGGAPADVPAPIRHALLLLITHWYEHRAPVEIGAAINAVPVMVSDLLHPYRRRRL